MSKINKQSGQGPDLKTDLAFHPWGKDPTGKCPRSFAGDVVYSETKPLSRNKKPGF
jgi:hypothetical protein